jgi:hypothetical protein
MFNAVHTISATEARSKLEGSEQKVNELLDRLQAAEESLKAYENDEVNKVSLQQSYLKWDRWNEVETLHQVTEEENEKVDRLTAKVNHPVHSHVHDHSEERKIFELEEKDKKALCERHRAKGNYLFHEGLLPKAAEQFHLALSYYGYCFPGNVLSLVFYHFPAFCISSLSFCVVSF